MRDSGPFVQDTPQTDSDFLPMNGTDYVEFWVGNAKQAAHFLSIRPLDFRR